MEYLKRALFQPLCDEILPIVTEEMGALKPEFKALGEIIAEFAPIFIQLIRLGFMPLKHVLPLLLPHLKKAAPYINMAAKCIDKAVGWMDDLGSKKGGKKKFGIFEQGGTIPWTGYHYLHEGETVIGQEDSQYVREDLLYESQRKGDLLLKLKEILGK